MLLRDKIVARVESSVGLGAAVLTLSVNGLLLSEWLFKTVLNR